MTMPQMASEFLREASVLLTVFAVLEKLLFDTADFKMVLAVAIVAALSFSLGVSLETSRGG